MVQTTTTLDVADNSGAKKLMCLRVLGGTRRKYASLGDVIVVSVKEAMANSKVKKGEVARAVIVRTKKEISRQDGSYIRFDSNSAVLVDKDNEPIDAPPLVARERPRLDELHTISHVELVLLVVRLVLRTPGHVLAVLRV